MKYSNLLIAALFSVFLASCSSNPVIHDDDLLKFANSNCFFWYFKSKDLNTDEIKKITSGIVENSQFSADKFQQVAFLVKDYAPAVETKSNVDVQLAEDMATFARLKDVIDPMDLYLHQSFMREEVPALFGLEFNTGSWQSGHVCVKDHSDQYLFATLNKRGRNAEHRYHDYFEDAKTFHWQSQNSGVSTSGKGKRVVEHQKNGSKLHLFVRKDRLIAKKGAPFYYCGTVNYVSHEGEKPMSVITGLDYELSEYLKLEFVG